MTTFEEFHDLVYDAAADEGCTAIETYEARTQGRWSVTPDDEAAGWCAELRLTWDASSIEVRLEHSGPWGCLLVSNTVEGRSHLVAWLRHELSA